MDQYLYRDDDGNIIELTFEKAIEKGQMFQKGGKWYRRVHEHNESPKTTTKKVLQGFVSDSLGFGQSQLGEMREHLEQSKCQGIEFTPDPKVPEFYQVRCSSRGAFLKYMESRGYEDQTSRNGGGTFTEKDLQDAIELASR